jgi:AcrR family transcriptional regulator
MTDPLITDGRTARRERNRNAVLDAVLELFGEGSTNPTPDEVATRSGVSLRSVYRYFDDRESLLRSAMEHHFHRIQPLFTIEIDPDLPLERRVEALVRQRLHLYEAAAPVFRAAIARSGTNPLIEERVRDRRALLARQVEQLFAPELAAFGAQAPGATAMVDVATEFESFDHLIRFRGLDRDDAATAVARAVHQLLRSS